ncbi:MAG: lipoate--protein ligase family protein, partial [Clostridiales bacterium]|nr:lipoate--protein ligase family protein [Clostridiales bacterium]
MKYFESSSTDPYFNLALEEYFLGLGTEEDIFLLWQNDNTVVVGRFQNTAQEINERFCRENHVRIVRRNSGGGAVYHDLGNLNFSIITNYKQGDDISFGRFLFKICEALKNIGVNAELHGRNDLVVNGLKISGSAQAIRLGRILLHGTLLCRSD